MLPPLAHRSGSCGIPEPILRYAGYKEKLQKRVDPYKRVRKVKWETNRVTVRNLEIINCWGEEYIKKLPKTMTVDLSRKETWALGTEVTLDTKGENEGFEVEMDRIPKIIEYCDDDTEDMQKEKVPQEVFLS